MKNVTAADRRQALRDLSRVRRWITRLQPIDATLDTPRRGQSIPTAQIRAGIRDFFESQCVRNRKSYEMTQDLWDRYRRYCAAGRRTQATRHLFTRELRQLGFTTHPYTKSAIAGVQLKDHG